MRIGYNREKTAEYEKRFGAVILAAGLSTRMKVFKPLLPVDGRPALEGLIETAKAAGLTDITVVTGHNRGALAPELARLGVAEAYNENYENGMFSSIQAGLAKARQSDKDGYLLMPVDCPLISVSVMRAVMDGAAEGGAFAVALFEGKKGHPLYIPAGHIDEILSSDGQGGLAAITDRYAEEMIRVETGEEGCLLDMDTPEGYADIQKFVAKGFAREKLELLTARKRIILVRHGETRQHEEPMFIGQYDVPLSEEGHAQAEELGKQIVGLIAGNGGHYCGSNQSGLPAACGDDGSANQSQVGRRPQGDFSGRMGRTSDWRDCESLSGRIRAQRTRHLQLQDARLGELL